MSSPWPMPDYISGTAMCCLCFEMKKFSELSITPEGNLIDVCMDCRVWEIILILTKAPDECYGG